MEDSANIEDAILVINGDNEGKSLSDRIVDAALLCKGLAGGLKGAFEITVSEYAWESEPRVSVRVWGGFGRGLAMASGCLPSNWYAFEASQIGEARGRPQRNYEWSVEGVKFSYVESFDRAGLSFEEAERQRDERAAIEKAAQASADPNHVPF